MVTAAQAALALGLERTDNMQRAYRLNQREQIILDLQVHHLDTQASSSLCGINKEIRMLKGALQQTKRSTGSSAELLKSSAREREEATPETRRIMYGTWVGERSFRTRSTLQAELLRNAARMRRRYERGDVDEEEEQEDGEEKEDEARDKSVTAEETVSRKQRTRSLPTRTEVETRHEPVNDLEIRPSSVPVTSRRKSGQHNDRRSLLARPKSETQRKVSGTQRSQEFEQIGSLELQTQARRSFYEEGQIKTKTMGRLSSSKVDLSAIASAKERGNISLTSKGTTPHSSRRSNETLTTATSRVRRSNKKTQIKAPNVIQKSTCKGHNESVRPFSADIAHLRHKLEKSRLHFGWTGGEYVVTRPRTWSDLSPWDDGSHDSSNRELEEALYAPSDIHSHDSQRDTSDSRPSTRGTWSFLTDTTKGGKKDHSNYHHSNRTEKSSNLDKGFPTKPRKVSRRGRRRSKLKATKVVPLNPYDIWINSFK